VLLDGVADVVEEADLARLLDVVADLGGDQPGNQRGVLAVDQDIGAVRAPVAERPEELDELRVDAGDAHLLDGCLALLAQPVGDLGAALGHHLLDARGVDAAVDEEPLQGHLGDLPAHRVESGEDHRFGVSSTITSMPVAASRARMLRPSRPMIRPFRSSVGRWTTVTAASPVCSEA